MGTQLKSPRVRDRVAHQCSHVASYRWCWFLDAFCREAGANVSVSSITPPTPPLRVSSLTPPTPPLRVSSLTPPTLYPPPPQTQTGGGGQQRDHTLYIIMDTNKNKNKNKNKLKAQFITELLLFSILYSRVVWLQMLFCFSYCFIRYIEINKNKFIIYSA